MLMTRINAPFPLWRFIKLPQGRNLDRALAAVQKHIAGLMERSRKRMQDQPSDNPRNLFEAMLAAGDVPGSGITDEVISANVMTLLLAGEDTTAHTLAWAMSFLCADARLQSRLHAAAAEVLGSARVCPSFDDLKRLDLFESVAHEATRLKPIVPLIYLEPLVDVVLGDVALPAGTPLFFVLRPRCWTTGISASRKFSCPGAGPPARVRCSRTTRGHMPSSAPVRVFAPAGTLPVSNCVWCCPCWRATLPWNWQPTRLLSRKYFPLP